MGAAHHGRGDERRMIRDADPKQFDVIWRDSGRWPQVKPNPDYPDGKDVDGVRKGETGCKVALPYPAKRIGTYLVRCRLCDFTIACTTAGRPDDPRSISVPCKVVPA